MWTDIIYSFVTQVWPWKVSEDWKVIWQILWSPIDDDNVYKRIICLTSLNFQHQIPIEIAGDWQGSTHQVILGRRLFLGL